MIFPYYAYLPDAWVIAYVLKNHISKVTKTKRLDKFIP